MIQIIHLHKVAIFWFFPTRDGEDFTKTQKMDRNPTRNSCSVARALECVLVLDRRGLILTELLVDHMTDKPSMAITSFGRRHNRSINQKLTLMVD